MNCRVVAVQYQLEVLDSWDAYKEKLYYFVKLANEQQADLLLLPEYAGMEIACLEKDSLNKQWYTLQEYLPQYLEYCANLAKDFHLYLQPGTLPVKNARGDNFYNRAYFFSPNGDYDYQDKIILTASEDAVPFLVGGEEIKIFDTAFGKMSIAICYDSEFASLTHVLASQNGVKILLVPSYTDSIHGFYRVHLCCRARAVEYQCYVVQACAHGVVNGCEFLDETAVGSSGIFAPPDNGFPDDGVLALGDLAVNNQLVSAELSIEKLTDVRKRGQVRNFTDLSQVHSVLNIIKIQHIKL